jgi:hypothetical protein
MKPKYYTYRFCQNQEIYQYKTHSKRLFLSNLRTINWQHKPLNIYLRVNYGKGFVNEGIYQNKKDLWLAFNAFVEKE